ncbi:MAG: trypsin-like peptidase domain-containing protein [Aquidulcibacter sp.]
MEPDDVALQEMVDALRVPREQFAVMYDELAEKHGSRKFKVTALYNRSTPYLAAFQVARDTGWLDELAERLLIADAFHSLSEPTPENESIRLQLQGVVAPSLGFVTVENLGIGVINAAKRVCRIEVGQTEPIMGTGFLVGPQAILTARHVIEHLLDPNGQPLPDSHKEIRVIFDEVGRWHQRTVCKVQTDWLVGSSPRHLVEAPNAQSAALEAIDPEEFRSCLDYAILRLDLPRGRERGYYELDATRLPSTIAPNCNISLYQHPDGAQMHQAYGAGIALWPDAVGTRLRHSANSLPGTSGGLILDSGSRPVAMHQCSFLDENGDPVVNGAIPTAFIAAQGDRTDIVIGLDPVWRLVANGQPVLGREAFQTCVLRALTANVRIIAVRGQSGTGKSFSTAILRAIVDDSANVVIEINASDIPIDAREFAQLLLQKMPTPGDSEVALPIFEDAETAREAWVRDLLVPALVNAMRSFSDGRKLWLVIDDLDKSPLADGSSKHLLERIHSDIGSYGFLRLVLLGQVGAVVAANPMDVQFDDIESLTKEDVAIYLSRRATAARESRSAAEIDGVADFVMATAQNTGGPLPAALTKALHNGGLNVEPTDDQ